MATADEILATMAEEAAETGQAAEVCTIDRCTRAVTIPEALRIVGVETDKDVTRRAFRVLCSYRGTNLSTFRIRIHFMNANKEKDIYYVTDAAQDGEYLTFSWVISRKATKYKGNLQFIACMVCDGGTDEEREWNSTRGEFTVLEGLEVEMTEGEEEQARDAITQLLEVIDTRESEAVAAVSAEGANQVAVVVAKGAETLATIPDDYAELSENVSALTKESGAASLNNLLYGQSYAKIQGTVKLATQEYSGLTEKSTVRAALTAGRRYLVYYSLVICEQTAGWPAATSFYPYLRNTATYSNIAASENVHVATYGSAVAGDALTFYGYCNPANDIASVGGWFITYNGGTAEKYADWIVDKVYLLDVTGLTDAECAEIVNRLDNITGHQEEVPLPTRLDKLERRVASIEQQIPEKETDLLFWGDSLTAGAGGNGTTYPAVCATELSSSHKNCGVGGESVNTIAARQGGNNIVIPAGAVNGAYAELRDVFGWTVAPLLQGHGANSGNRLIINGEECTLSYAAGTGYTISGYTGAAIAAPTLARFAGSDFTGKVVVIWVGTNGGAFPGLSTGVDIRIALINSMVRHIGHGNYVVMGLTVGEGNADFYINEENKMWAAFGNKYFPTRKLLVENGLTINGLVPTDDDANAIAKGAVPAQLLSDTVHLNAYGYTAVGKMLADKIRSLGYRI